MVLTHINHIIERFRLDIKPVSYTHLDVYKRQEYQIIAGERRYRASQRAGLKTIPAYIRTADDENMMEMALIENIQREDLNAVEIRCV